MLLLSNFPFIIQTNKEKFLCPAARCAILKIEKEQPPTKWLTSL